MEKSKLLEKISRLYSDNLWGTPAPLDYLVINRGLTEQTINDNNIGYSNGDILIKSLDENEIDEATELGLLKNKREFFEGYLVFPVVSDGCIFNMYGRAMGKITPIHKTLPNIPKNCLYNSKALDNKGVLIVESPIDCLTLVQNQLNSCAVMGTKMSDEAAKKFVGIECYILFDKDPSGQLGADKVARKIFNLARKVCIIDFPGNLKVKLDANQYFGTVKSAAERIKFLVKNSVPLKTAPFGKQYKKEKKILNAWEDNIDVVAVGRIVFKDEHHVDKGDELWVRCPFHKEGNETNRSLWIGGKKNIWYCFGCQRGGGPIYLVSWGKKICLEDGRQWISERFTESQVLT